MAINNSPANNHQPTHTSSAPAAAHITRPSPAINPMASAATPGRSDLRAAMAKAVELRALHAALLLGAGGGASPSPSTAVVLPRAAGEEYPVFTPSYEEQSSRQSHLRSAGNRSLSETWSNLCLAREDADDDGASLPEDLDNAETFHTSNSELRFCTSTDHMSNKSSCRSHRSFLQSAASVDSILKPSVQTTSSIEFKAITTCNTCRPAMISRGGNGSDLRPLREVISDNGKPPLPHPEAKTKAPRFAWLFPKGNKKPPKPEMVTDALAMSQLLKECGMFSLESLKKDLLEANESRDAALREVADMRSSFGELTGKMASLEAYCEELKNALKQAMHAKSVQLLERPNLSERTASSSEMPVSREAMLEGFLQVVSEARLSVKQFCKALIQIVEEGEDLLAEKINLLLRPHHVALSGKCSKGVLYHLEAAINETLYLDFENCVFRKNGAPKYLEPRKERQEKFASFVALRNLGWSEVLRKGTKYHSEELSRFCDDTMGRIVSALGWGRPWPEQLLQSFFVAAKCAWLLHLLAFSFEPPLRVLRVEEGRVFDAAYMEDMVPERQRFGRAGAAPATVKIMVMPGFYVLDRVLKCRVLCRYS